MLCYTAKDWIKVVRRLTVQHCPESMHDSNGLFNEENMAEFLSMFYHATPLWARIPERWIVIKFEDKRYKTLFLLKTSG